MSGGETCEAPPMAVSSANASESPPPLASFSCDSGPQDVAQDCPHRNKSGGDPPPALASSRPKKPCDVQDLKVQVAEPGATDKPEERLIFDTLKASDGNASRRPRDLPVADNVPEPIRSQLATHDLVIEVIAPTSDAGLGKISVPGATADADHEKQMAKSKAKTSASAGTTTLTVGSTWTAHCGDPAHAGCNLTVGDKPVEHKPAAFILPIKSKSKADLKNIWHFITSGLNPKVLGNPYDIAICSCGVTTKGPATTSLSALVTAYPPGVTGLKVAFEGFAFDFGWAGTAADDYAKKYMKSQESYLESTDAKEIDERLSAVKASQTKLEQKRPTSGKKIADHKVKLQSARQEVSAMQHRLEAKEEMDKSPFSVNIILFDEEIEAGEVYEKAKKAIANIKKAERTLSGFMNAISFLRTYSPSIVTPVAKISFSCLLQTEIFVGFKLASNDRYKGTRWRGLPRCFDIEVNCKALEVSGSFGAVIGKSVLGTGATVEILFSPIASVSLGAEYSSPSIMTDKISSWKDTELKVQGSFSGTGSLSGKVTAFYCKLAYASASANGSGRLSTGNKLSEVFGDDTHWKWTLTLDPVGGMIKAHLIGWGDPWEYPYQLWEGGAWPL